MNLAPVEIGRLAIMQRSPLRYIERRVEHLDFTDDYHYGVKVTQQILVPSHGERKRVAPEERELLIPLGQFSKDRLPDLCILSPDGSVLPLLSRVEHGYIAGTLFTTRWQEQFFKGLSKSSLPEAQEVWDIIHLATAQIAVDPVPSAYLAIYRLKSYLAESSYIGALTQDLRHSVRTVLARKAFWQGLRALAESRLLVARFHGVPGRRYVITIQYTERFHYRGYATRSVSSIFRKVLAWIGVIGLPIARSVANLGQATSLWIVQSVPEGVEPLRYYWKQDRHNSRPADPVSVGVTHAVAARHDRSGKMSKDNLLLLDVQVSPSTAIVATILLAAFLLFVSTYIYQALPALNADPDGSDRAILIGLGSIFAAVPSGIAGALAYRGETFVRRASSGPRIMLMLLSLQAAFLAVVISLKDLGSLAEFTAYLLSIYSTIVIVIFSFIQFGPRWRKNERSRRKSVTSVASPIDCRKSQIRAAVLWLAFWAVAVVVFARTQAVLQQDHFFTHDFPGNVWDAWWSWFGL